MIGAEVVQDSISPRGHRLTTMVFTYHRYILAEANTHRAFSRNSASSRAIPVEKMLSQVENDPAVPVFWGANQKGMSAQTELDDTSKAQALHSWLTARDAATLFARKLAEIGLHKQTANRIIEPWMITKSVITATDFDNFFWQRCDPTAQPEMRELADKALVGMNASEPRSCHYGEWHLPFVTPMERTLYEPEVLVKCSTARSARVSYRNHDGSNPDVAKDLILYQSLLESVHPSPFEHPAQAVDSDAYSKNFRGWRQHREDMPNENRTDFPRLLRKTWRG